MRWEADVTECAERRSEASTDSARPLRCLLCVSGYLAIPGLTFRTLSPPYLSFSLRTTTNYSSDHHKQDPSAIMPDGLAPQVIAMG